MTAGEAAVRLSSTCDAQPCRSIVARAAMTLARNAAFHAVRPSPLAVGSISPTIRSIMPSRRSSLLATCLYSDIGSTPSSWPSRRMLTASMPCSSASSTAARSTRSRLRG